MCIPTAVYLYCSNISADDMLYTETDLEDSMEKIETINFHEVKEVAGIKFWCYHAGHVLGAAMFMIEIAGVKVCSSHLPPPSSTYLFSCCLTTSHCLLQPIHTLTACMCLCDCVCAVVVHRRFLPPGGPTPDGSRDTQCETRHPDHSEKTLLKHWAGQQLDLWSEHVCLCPLRVRSPPTGLTSMRRGRTARLVSVTRSMTLWTGRVVVWFPSLLLVEPRSCSSSWVRAHGLCPLSWSTYRFLSNKISNTDRLHLHLCTYWSSNSLCYPCGALCGIDILSRCILWHRRPPPVHTGLLTSLWDAFWGLAIILWCILWHQSHPPVHAGLLTLIVWCILGCWRNCGVYSGVLPSWCGAFWGSWCHPMVHSGQSPPFRWSEFFGDATRCTKQSNKILHVQKSEEPRVSIKYHKSHCRRVCAPGLWRERVHLWSV